MTQGRRREIGKVTALTNPASGHGAAIRAAQLAIARLHHRGVEVVEIIGDDAQDARYLVGAELERGTDAVMVTVPVYVPGGRPLVCTNTASELKSAPVFPLTSPTLSQLPAPLLTLLATV